MKRLPQIRQRHKNREERDATRLARDRARRQQVKARSNLSDMLGRADEESFIQLVWAVDAIQSDREQAARGIIEYPKEAVTTELSNRFHVYKWELETLVNELLTVRRVALRSGQQNRILNCGTFSTIAALNNQLRDLENADSGIVLARMSVLTELHRIAQRTFEWQRGFVNVPQYYKWAYIFSGPICEKYFIKKHGISIEEFNFVGFALITAFAERPIFRRDTDLQPFGIDADKREAAVRMMSAALPEARQRAALLRLQQRGTAYEPSVLRQNPILAFGRAGERLRAPLPELIATRTTEGIYYDLVDGPAEVRNEIGDRFELYARELLATLDGVDVLRSYTYGSRGNQVGTPDLLIRRDGRPTLPVECKAKKMTIQAKFGEDPVAEASAGYDEIAKGVFQLWRFFTHARCGLHGEPVQDARTGIVLTLDSWLSMAGVLRQEVIKRAEELATRDPQILAEDRKPIVFCSIEDLERTLRGADANDFERAVIAAATDEKFTGWSLPNVLDKVREHERDNPYPFAERIGEVLPWWARLEQLRENH